MVEMRTQGVALFGREQQLQYQVNVLREMHACDAQEIARLRGLVDALLEQLNMYDLREAKADGSHA
jgi:hypothetical protein